VSSKRSIVSTVCCIACMAASAGELKVEVEEPTPRMAYAIEQVRAACDAVSANGTLRVNIQDAGMLKPEGFRLKGLGASAVEVVGADQSGVLYGCLELAERIREAGAIPGDLDFTDAPEFKLRGPCIGMQKLIKDPYGGHYHWPYKPETFPFFYDKALWRKYLDFLVEIRMNSLSLWNGHPFSSLVQLDDYPEALEVSPETLEKNREMMYWLTSECDKRGIWLIQMFYNIHLPEKLGLGTQLNRSEPKAADYTRKSIAKFVETYPNVGLLLCLGEALSGKEAQVEWFTETIIPGMYDGLKARGQTELPPIVVRGHHIVEYGSHEEVLSEGLKLYPNLLSMVKYNGESLTSETPRGKYQQFHKDMAKYSGTHMANVHLLSNLEPFRYADFSFIWNSSKAIRDRLDGNGLHLYPLAYWDWPNTPDTAPGVQFERDRLWFEIWARYAWRLDREPAEERAYWIGRLIEIYGDHTAAEAIYEAYDAAGECAPRILRRFGITGGNRQCLELGMYLSQLTDPKGYSVWQELYDSDSPPGETITQYIENEVDGKPHVGETPPQVIDEVLAFAAKAVEQIEAAAPHVKENREEFERLRNDIHCIAAMSRSYCAKVNAAMMVHRYRHSNDPVYMQKALPFLEESLEHYKTLTALTKDRYRYSNAYHGRQSIPKGGVFHWSHMVGDYEAELADFKEKVAALGEEPAAPDTRTDVATATPWLPAPFELLSDEAETYEVTPGARVFTDRDYALKRVAPQLTGLTGIRFSHQHAKTGGTIAIEFEVAQPVKVLVGYFQDGGEIWLQVPMLEHVAHANERGGLDPILQDVADIGEGNLDLPAVNVHAFEYGIGRHVLEMIGQGSYVVLGVVAADAAFAKPASERTRQGRFFTPEKQKAWQKALTNSDYEAIVKAYADYMIEHGRDRYGEVHSPLFVSAMDRKTATVFKHGNVPYPHVIVKPYAPGLRRDHKMRPQDRTYSGGNPLEDLPLYGLLYRLSETTGDERYRVEADKSIAWFLEHAQSPVTGLYAWGSHLYWDVHKDQPIYANTGQPDAGYGGHEYNYVWPYWDQNPEALTRFAHGIWNHQITNQKTGNFSRHADYHRHGLGTELFEFPQTASCYMDIWAREYGRSGDPEMKQAIQTLLKLYRSMRDPETGAMAWCTAEGADRREVANVQMNLFMATTLQDAAAFVEKRDPSLAQEMTAFARFVDEEYLSNEYDKILNVAEKGILTWYTLADRTCMAKGFTPPPEGVDGSVGFPLTAPDGAPAASLYYLTPWFPGRSYAGVALLLRDRYERCEMKHKATYRRALIEVADIYMTIGPEVQFAQYPDNASDVVELLRYCHEMTENLAYLHRADQIMRVGLRLFFDETSPLPKISNLDDWYESSTKNESSVAILRQMLELSRDLAALPENMRSAPEVATVESAGLWQSTFDDATPDALFRYGAQQQYALYLSQSKDAYAWHITLSDTIRRIPTPEEADSINGRMAGFTGKGFTTDHIDYGGFKDVPRRVALTVRNSGQMTKHVRIQATLHDTYHDHGVEQCEKTLVPGEAGTFVLTSPPRKWIRRLSIDSDKGSDGLRLEQFAFASEPRSGLNPEPPAPSRSTD